MSAKLPMFFKADRMLVFGHRGARAYAPMNTIPSFELALAQGADGVEFDVHMSADGELVIIHDFTVDATTNGRGAVDEMTLAQLQALDAGSWFDAKYTGTKIPTLDETFAAIGKTYANVEIKAATAGIEQAVADCIRRNDMVQNVIVSSFNPMVLANFHRAAPDIAVAFLYEADTPDEFWDVVKDVPLAALHPNHEMINEALMQSAKERGASVNTWTVNAPERAVELRDLGVSVVITDTPDIIRRALGYA